MSKRTSIIALIHLSRYHDYLLFVTTVTLLGLLFSNVSITQKSITQLSLVLLANLLAVCFSFMINDVEDASDDALNPDKMHRNPISAGRLSRRRALAATIAVGIASAIVYSFLGLFIAFLGLLMLIVSGLYSWKMIRLKNIPIIDIVSHSFMLGGLIFLTSYFSFVPFTTFSVQWIIPLVFITTLSAYGELFNEVRDLTYDKKAGLTHTAAIVGKSLAEKLMYGFVIVAICTLFYGVYISLIPLWIIPTAITLTLIFSLPSLFYSNTFNDIKKSEKFQESVLLSGMITIVLWIIFKSLSF